MKNRVVFIRFVISFCVILLLIVSIGCTKNREKEYYEDINNYISDEAIVENIIYNEEEDYIVLWLSVTNEAYQIPNFIIEGENANIVLKKDILEKLKVGDTVKFISAPKIFGNGDFLPIVALSVSNDKLLDFETGYENLLDLYNK